MIAIVHDNDETGVFIRDGELSQLDKGLFSRYDDCTMAFSINCPYLSNTILLHLAAAYLQHAGALPM